MSDVLVSLDELGNLGALARSTPPTPGVLYRHYDADGALLYLGSSDRQKFRHRQADHAREARWWRYVVQIEHELVLPDRRAAYLAEVPAIRTESPIFNRHARRDPQAQIERESAYVLAHANVPNRWPPPRRKGNRMDRMAEVNAMLAELGVWAPPRPMVQLKPAKQHLVLDLGEYMQYLALTTPTAPNGVPR